MARMCREDHSSSGRVHRTDSRGKANDSLKTVVNSSKVVVTSLGYLLPSGSFADMELLGRRIDVGETRVYSEQTRLSDQGEGDDGQSRSHFSFRHFAQRLRREYTGSLDVVVLSR
jgi:hypothetical protein